MVPVSRALTRGLATLLWLLVGASIALALRGTEGVTAATLALCGWAISWRYPRPLQLLFSLLGALALFFMWVLHTWTSLAFFLVIVVAGGTSPTVLSAEPDTAPGWGRRVSRGIPANIVGVSGRNSIRMIFDSARSLGIPFAVTATFFVFLLRRIPLIGTEGSGRLSAGNYTLS